MANIVLDNLKTLYLNGKQVKTLFVNGKQVKMSYNVSFSTNMANYYYISGQGGTATTVAAPATQIVPAGSAIGTLPTLGTTSSPYTYTLSSQSYSIYVEGWYTESTLVNKVTTTWVPDSDCTLYAKWKMTANKAITSAVSITIPKFIYSAYSWCRGAGGSRTAKSAAASNANCISFAFSLPGGNSTAGSATTNGVGGKSLVTSTTSIKIGGTTVASSSNAAAGATYAALNYNLYNNCRTAAAGSVTAMNTGGCKVIISWPAGSNVEMTATFYYNNAKLTSTKVIGKKSYTKVNDGENEYHYEFFLDNGGYNNWYATNWSSGGTGAAGAYGCSSIKKTSTHTLSIPAASGTAGSLSVTLYA